MVKPLDNRTLYACLCISWQMLNGVVPHHKIIPRLCYVALGKKTGSLVPRRSRGRGKRTPGTHCFAHALNLLTIYCVTQVDDVYVYITN